MDLGVLLRNASPGERELIAKVSARADAERAIVITIALEGSRRYVVVQEDEPMFEGLAGLSGEHFRDQLDGCLGPQFLFGARRVRKYGDIDPAYRSLSLHEVTSVTAVDRRRAWEGERVPGADNAPPRTARRRRTVMTAEQADPLGQEGNWEIRTTIYCNGKKIAICDTTDHPTFDAAVCWAHERLATRDVDLHQPKPRTQR